MINKEGPTAWHEKANPRPNEPGVRRDPFWDNRALPGLSPGDFSSPHLRSKRFKGCLSSPFPPTIGHKRCGAQDENLWLNRYRIGSKTRCVTGDLNARSWTGLSRGTRSNCPHCRARGSAGREN